MHPSDKEAKKVWKGRAIQKTTWLVKPSDYHIQSRPIRYFFLPLMPISNCSRFPVGYEEASKAKMSFSSRKVFSGVLCSQKYHPVLSQPPPLQHNLITISSVRSRFSFLFFFIFFKGSLSAYCHNWRCNQRLSFKYSTASVQLCTLNLTQTQ